MLTAQREFIRNAQSPKGARLTKPSTKPSPLSRFVFLAGVVATLVMGVGTAITVTTIAMIAVGARTWAKRFTDSRSGYGMLAMRGVEAGAAPVIIAFGSLLLTGYIVTERMVGV
jgi:nickel/cobalt exporter